MEKISKKQPVVCSAARTVGIIKPVFDPHERGFKPPQLDVRGTGFWIKNSGVFITCAHVIEDLLGAPIELVGMLVVGGNGVEYKKAVVSFIDQTHDLAVLSVDADPEYIKAQDTQGLEINEDDLEVGESVGYAGFPLGNQLLNPKHSPTYTEGVIGQEMISSNGPKWVQISGPVIGGYSGGPIVLKETGKVIAIVSNSPSKEAGGASIFKGVHWRHIKKLVELVNS